MYSTSSFTARTATPSHGVVWDYQFIALPIVVLGLFLLTGCGSNEPTCEAPPCAPDEALSTLEVVDGFQVELFAAEPLIRDPVAMTVDEQGRVYVVEDPGYPENRDDYQGAVKLLLDTNGDGWPDESTVFADEFRAPRGVMRWRDGILVTDASEIFYLEDTTGDGVADQREVLMSGFGFGNPQLGVNSPIYGLDNWVYVANRQGGTPRFGEESQDDEQTVRSNVRFRPDTEEWEALSGNSQFGHSFDAYGRHLLVSWDNHIYQEVMDARYLERNPDLMVAPVTEHISDHGAITDVYPITENPRRELFTNRGTTTSTCGIICYLGDAFPAEYQGAAFVAEPTHNLVHVDRLEEGGAALQAHRMHDDTEFLASTDHWFRPVNHYVGPDGALYVVDYYREIIEQPRFLSEEVLEAGILDGTEQGRIYRVSSDGADGPDWHRNLDLGNASTDELVGYLEHGNAWWRTNAQRLIMHREDAPVDALEELASTSEAPYARVHALRTLEGLGYLEAQHLLDALEDEHPRVREQAIRMTEQFLGDHPEFEQALLALESDEDGGVRYQLLSTLGDLEEADVQQARQRMLYDDMEDRWIQLAALSAQGLDYLELFEEAHDRLIEEETAGHSTYFRSLGMLIGVRQHSADLQQFVNVTSEPAEGSDVWWQAAGLDGLAEGLRFSGDLSTDPAFIQEPMAQLSLHPASEELRNAAQRVMSVTGPPTGPAGEQVFQRAEQLAVAEDEDAILRRDAIRLLRLGDVAGYQEALMQLVDPQEPTEVQAEAARALADIEGPELGSQLLAQWGGMTAQVRLAAMETLLADDERVRMVLDAVEEGDLRRSDVTLEQTRSLMLHQDEDLRRRARELLGSPDEERSEVVDQYRPAIAMVGDVERGREVHIQNCAMCHQMDGEDGVHFGPDLAGVRGRNPEDLLVNILMPNEEIAAGYEQWRIERQNGDVVRGAIASETPSALTVRDASGQETSIPRADVANMVSIDESVMPTGLERQISVEEMADLLAFIRNQPDE